MNPMTRMTGASTRTQGVRVTRSVLLARVLAASALCLVSVAAWSQVPERSVYQGRLTDASGVPLSGTADVSFRIYDSDTPGGAPLYSENHANVPLGADGVFNVQLGGGASDSATYGASLFSGSPRYLEVLVDGELLSPRQELTSVPWALEAQDALVAQSMRAPPTRFEACADAQTVADHQTGLLWEKKTGSLAPGPALNSPHDVGETYSWCLPDPAGGPFCSSPGTNPPSGSAFTDFLSSLNDPTSGTASSTNDVTGCFAGLCDWRLPTIAELTTILDAGCSGGAPCLLPEFDDAGGIAGAGGASASSYWSASEHADSPGSAWIVDFGLGGATGAYSVAKQDFHSARAVRTGSCARDVGSQVFYALSTCSISCTNPSAPLGGNCGGDSTCTAACPASWVAECNCDGIILCQVAQCGCIAPPLP